jgi:WhiB family redox-sensing transcriptional regulator
VTEPPQGSPQRTIDRPIRWPELASCRSEDEYFFFAPETESLIARSRREVIAREICAGCTVVEKCRQYAIGTGQKYGIWGGMTELELRSKHSGRT